MLGIMLFDSNEDVIPAVMLVGSTDDTSEVSGDDASLGMLEGCACGDITKLSFIIAAFVSKEDGIEISPSIGIDFACCNVVVVWNVDVILDDVNIGEAEDTSPNVSRRVSHPAS